MNKFFSAVVFLLLLGIFTISSLYSETLYQADQKDIDGNRKYTLHADHPNGTPEEKLGYGWYCENGGHDCWT